MKKVKIKNSRYKSTDDEKRSRENSKGSIVGSQENIVVVPKTHRKKHKKRNMKCNQTMNF
jgi:hypothetical protein